MIEWKATEDYAFPAADDHIVHGGMVATLLDTAMGQSTWTLLDRGEVFLTADLHTDFYRPARPGLLRAEGRVVHKTRRTAFAVADLFDDARALLDAGAPLLSRARNHRRPGARRPRWRGASSRR